MISGSYVLTDTLSKSFDSVYEESYAATDAIISSSRRSRPTTATRRHRPSPPPSLREVERCRAFASRRARSRTRPGWSTKAGRRSATPRRDRLGGRHLGRPEPEPARARQGEWPSGDGEIAIDKATAEKQDFAVGADGGGVRDGAVDQYRITGIVTFGAADSLGGVVHLRLRPRHRPEAVRQAGQVRPDPCRRQSRRLGGRARGPDPAAALRDDAGPGRRGAGGRGQQGDPGGHGHHQVRPARLRRDLALRRQLRDREHARDHRRAAHARARDAADARGLAAPGAPLGRARVGRGRARRLVGGPLPRARHRRRADGAAGDARASSCRAAGSSSRPGRSSSASRSGR